MYRTIILVMYLRKQKIKIDVLTYLILSCMKMGQMHTNKKDEVFIWYEEL